MIIFTNKRKKGKHAQIIYSDVEAVMRDQSFKIDKIDAIPRVVRACLLANGGYLETGFVILNKCDLITSKRKKRK